MSLLFLPSRDHEKDCRSRATDQEKAIQSLDAGKKAQMTRGINIAKSQRGVIDDGKVENVHECIDILLSETAYTYDLAETETQCVEPGFNYVGGREGIECNQQPARLRERSAFGGRHYEIHCTDMHKSAQTEEHNREEDRPSQTLLPG